MFLIAALLTIATPVVHSSTKCVAIDGDTIVCVYRGKRLHLRVNGIDTPELPGHCHGIRICTPGDPFASKAETARFIAGHRVSWIDLGKDRYMRTIAEVRVGKKDLGCNLLTKKLAVYVPKWDNKKTLQKVCKDATSSTIS